MERIRTSGGIAFADGYRVGRGGNPNTANPHRVGSAEAAAWLDGRNEGSARRAWINASDELDAHQESGGRLT